MPTHTIPSGPLPIVISKVALFCDFFSSLGGTENYNMLLAEELVKRGIEVRVYIGEKPRRSDWIDRLTKIGVEPRTPHIYHTDLSQRDIEKKFIDEIADEIALWSPDVIHAHPFKKMAICWLNNPRTDHAIPIVATEWTVPTNNAMYWFEPDTTEHINSVSAYIATCQAAAHGIRDYHKYRGPVFTVPHLLAHPASRVDLPIHPAGDVSFSVGCVARFSVEKGVMFLLGAWQKVHACRPTARLHLYGHGDDERWLRELCICLGIQESVRFEGTFAPGTIATIASRHDFFIQPSLFESIPTSAIELMACGRTIIATRVGGLPELIDHDAGLMVDPASTDQLSTAILSLGNDPGRVRRLSENAYRVITQRYDTQKSIDNILCVYRSVISRCLSSNETVEDLKKT